MPTVLKTLKSVGVAVGKCGAWVQAAGRLPGVVGRAGQRICSVVAVATGGQDEGPGNEKTKVQNGGEGGGGRGKEVLNGGKEAAKGALEAGARVVGRVVKEAGEFLA
jgi:hypothetical protein